MPAFLQVLNGKKAGVKFQLTGDEIKLGRHPDCDIPLDGSSVSRFHAHLHRVAGGYEIVDQKSRNGTLVNGKKIESAVVLRDQDRVKICETLFVYRDEVVTDPMGQSTTEPPAVDDDRPSTVVSTLDAQGSSALLTGVRPEIKLKAIYEISQAIAQTLDLDLLFEKILECAFRIFPQADRGLVIQAEGESRYRPRASRQRHEDQDTIRFSRTVVARCLEDRQAILSADAASDDRFSLSESIADFRIRSVMCVPLLGAEQRPLGVIQLDTQSHNQKFAEEDLQVLMSMASQAAIAMENARMHEEMLDQARIKRELGFARDVQQGFLPRHMPMLTGYEFWAYYEAAGQVGGDYYDFVSLPDGRQAVIVADVSGKGVPAALLMARVSSDAKVALFSNPNDPAAAVAELNRQLCSAGLDDRFITMALSIVDPVNNLVQIVNAGHMSPVVRRRDGTIFEPAVEDKYVALPLGIVPSAEYLAVEIPLGVGDIVVTYSDGINEAMNTSDQPYTTDRLRQQLQDAKSHASEVGESIIADVRTFSANRSQHDDMTLVVYSRPA